MRVLIQRVDRASVTIENSIKSKIDKGLLILLGVEEADANDDIEWLTSKIVNLRIFDDENGVMNISTLDYNADILVVSQFTLYASTKKGNRPSYIKAAKPEVSVPLYNSFCKTLSRKMNKTIQTGEFGAHMLIESVNNGPVSIWIDSKNRE